MISERIKHLKEHGQLVVELAHMRKDGSSMQVEISARLVTLGESDVIFSVVRDITERKRAEDELRRSERVLREAEELGHTGSWEHNLITGEIFNSKENARMFFGDDSSKGARFDDYGDAVHPDDRAFVMERHAQLLAEGGPRDIEFRVVWPDGGVHVLFGRATVVRDESGQAIRVYGTNLDITERKRAEKALLQSQEKYRLIVDAANEGIWVIDEYDKTSFVNAQMADMLGYEVEEMIGRKLESFMFGEDLPDYAQKKEKRRQGIAEHFERQWRRKDGQVVQTIVSATPIIDNEHHFLGSFAMILDITERKKLEAQLRQAQKMESIGTLAGGVAHDFNNILTAIIGYGHIALLKMSKDDPNRTNIEQILEASNRATHLTKDLLLFSRKQPLDRKPIDLNEDILKLGKFLVRVIGEDIAFKTSLSGGTIPVFADEHQIGQVLMNLATNSRDSMPKGGTFTISTELVHLDEEFTSKHGLEMPGKYVLISVSDTGHGMDEETKQRIFEPFYTTKEVGKGTGLGLAVVYGIVKQHAGCINVYSEPGIGTTFKIYLPVIVSGAAEEKATTSEELPVGGTETILLAEDNESVRNLIVSVLKESGYTVITAVDGEDAVSKYQENEDKIQLLLFDLIMPKKNGKEAYDEISQIRPDIKAIFASGYSPDIIRDKGALGSSTTVVYKPISPIDLLKKVRSVLDEGKLNMNL
jgi:PAS domain S-box-containing protein